MPPSSKRVRATIDVQNIRNDLPYSAACRTNAAALAELTEQQQGSLLQCHFLFGLVWSIGANTDDEGRHTFDTMLRKLMKGETPSDLNGFVTSPTVSCLGLAAQSGTQTLLQCSDNLLLNNDVLSQSDQHKFECFPAVAICCAAMGPRCCMMR